MSQENLTPEDARTQGIELAYRCRRANAFRQSGSPGADKERAALLAIYSELMKGISVAPVGTWTELLRRAVEGAHEEVE